MKIEAKTLFREDYHLHSRFSPDSTEEPEKIIKTAYEKGLERIIFTEHCEANLNEAMPEGKPAWPPLDIPAYTSKIEELKKTAPMSVGIGIELGQATFALENAEKALNAYDWDFVLGSMHNIRNGIDFYYVDYSKADIEGLTKLYFEDLYDLVKWNGFDVLSHLYYHLRYIYRQHYTLDIKKHEPEIREIFRLLVENGKGIEVNTSSFDGAFGDVIPGLYFLKVYKEVGGEIITVGSDAHKAERIALGFDYAYDLLREAGFKAVSVFEKRKVSFKDIV